MNKSSGLIITLVVFIILTILLGVGTYFSAQGYSETKQKLAERESAATKSDTEVKKLTKQIEDIKTKIGYPAVDTDQLLAQLDEDIKSAFGYDPAATVPQNYRDTLIALSDALMKSKTRRKEAEDQRDNAAGEATRQTEIAVSQKETFDNEVKQQGERYAEMADEAETRYENLSNANEDLAGTVEKIREEAAKTNEEYRTIAADAEEATKMVSKINVNLRDRLDQMSQAEFEIPDGNILYVDQINRRVRLNIGSADGLRLLTNFSVFAADAVETGIMKPKGAIDVVRIIGEHESEALIRSDELNNPFLPGDLIYTPLWKVGDQVQFALDYFLDIDGDGSNDVDMVVDLISANGSRVVAWIDDEGKIHGEPNPETSYFIVGNEQLHELLKNDMQKTNEQKDAIEKAHTDLYTMVRDNNVRDIRLSQFLRQINYRPTANVAKFQEQGGVKPEVSNGANTLVSHGTLAPIYTPGMKGNTLDSKGTTAAIYGKGAGGNKLTSPGHVSDFYFQKRNPSK